MCYVWNRVYKTEFLERINLKFIEGMVFEDVDFVTRAVYFLNKIVLNVSYVDSSNVYIDSVFVYKNILKGIIYFFIFAFTLLEFKLDKLLLNNSKKKKS